MFAASIEPVALAGTQASASPDPCLWVQHAHLVAADPNVPASLRVWVTGLDPVPMGWVLWGSSHLALA